jgi:capsular exopolysaccharide synthesis family protein
MDTLELQEELEQSLPLEVEPVAKEREEPADRSLHLGDTLSRLGVISEKDIKRILKKSHRDGLAFGTAAKKLGLVTERDIRIALSIQNGLVHDNRKRVRVPQALVTLHAPRSEAAEQFRRLRTRLLTINEGAALRLLSIASTGNSAGSSFVAANLAVSISQLGRKVLLIDSNLRDSDLNYMFNMKPGVGLTEVVSGQMPLKEAFAPPLVRNVTLLRAGAATYNPQELLSSSEYATMVLEQMDHFDTVLVNAGDAVQSADAQLVWALTKSVLLVARRDKSRVRNIKKLSRAVKECRAELVGTVMTR